jgi:negative regulator of flagellin synthesis FlgM
MSIDKLSAQGAARSYVQNTTDVARAADTKDAARAGHAQQHQRAQQADSVSLSADARSLQAAREAVQRTPDVREQKVAAIKQRVDDGTYFVPASTLARTIVDATNTTTSPSQP